VVAIGVGPVANPIILIMADTSQVALDLVITTVGRTAQLERLLRSVAEQSYRKVRVIVVDQNEDDRLKPVLAPFMSALEIHHLRAVPGATRARNLGLAEVSSDLVAFPDDDCWYPDDALDRVVNAFQEHPEWDALSGTSCDESGRPTQLRWDRAAGVITRSNVFRRAITFTVFMRRSLIESLGEWDETFGPRPGPDGTFGGASDESEYLLRALAQGFTIGYEPSIRIVHADFTPSVRDRSSMGKAYSYGLDHSRLLRQYGFSRWYATWRSAQLIAASVVFLVRGEPGKARFYAAMARGRLAGTFLHTDS
jgi:glycosyltransferase involved in cell wall biosynthesis